MFKDLMKLKESETAKEAEKWFRVSLRLVGDGLPVEQVGEQLGIEPSFMGKAGEHIRGDERLARHRTNLWGWAFTQDSAMPFERQMDELLAVLEGKKDVLGRILAIPGVRGELFLGFSAGSGHGGAYFSPRLLARISELGLALNLDLYPNS